MKYRPWGKIDWLLSLSGTKDWHFVGTLGTEERSLCSWKLMKDIGILSGELFFRIRDENSEKYRVQCQRALENRYKEFKKNGGDPTTVDVVELMSELFIIQQLSFKATSAGESIVLDVTSMPKRFFFLLLRALTLNNNIKNLLVTYCSPASYTDDILYEDIDSWKNLPGFGGCASRRENLIVSIGFLVESLKSYFSTMPNHGKIKMIIPFPAPLAALKRTWESVSNIERDQDSSRFEKYRVDSLDMSTAFDYIVSSTSNSQNPTAFAPFGPKPISVAMCLYAIQRDSAVYYPQPTVYHPEYSKGIKNNDPMSAVTGYWVKHEGNNLYEI